MIKSLKVSNVAHLSFQLHFNAKKEKEISFKINDSYLYNMLLLTCDDKSDPSYFLFPFTLLSYLGTEYFNELCFSVGSPVVESKIEIEFFYYNIDMSEHDLIKYVLVFNQHGIIKELLNDIDIRDNNSSKYATELPELITSYFQTYQHFNCLNEIQVNKYYSISVEMIKSSSTFKKFVVDFFNRLGYIVNDLFFDDNELQLIYKYASGKVDVEYDNELKLITALASVLFVVFMKNGILYISNAIKVLPHESTVSFYEILSSHKALKRVNCQFLVEERDDVFNFLYNSNFSFSPLIEDVQIIKVTEYLNTPIVEWKKN